MKQKPPLHIHIYYHPQSDEAHEIASALISTWMNPPGIQGLRVPLFLTPDDGTGKPPDVPDLDIAQHSLVVFLVDSIMTRRVRGQGGLWADFLQKLLCLGQPGSKHHILPVAFDSSAFEFDPKIAELHFLSLDNLEDQNQKQARISFTMCVRSLHLLWGGIPNGEEVKQAPITLFISHAKLDLDDGLQDPVRLTQDALSMLPIREWFDAREIREGAGFEKEIRDGIKRSDAMLLFLTDHWASRSYCRFEAIIAKEIGTPVVVVDALENGEPRRFPYGGNTRSIRWRSPLRPAEKQYLLHWRKKARIEGELVIAAGVREALRRVHARYLLEGLKKPDDIVLDVSPEAARLAFEPPESTFLYPDPPLGKEEKEIIQRIRPKSKFHTPMTRIAQRRSGMKPALIAVSVSESTDLAQMGLTLKHQRLLTDEIHLYLLMAGLQIAYGGKLDPDKLNDPDNFTLRLFSLARSYKGLALDAGVSKIQPILNAVPWPLWKLYEGDVLDVFGNIADLEEFPCPDIGFSNEELGELPNGFVPPSGPRQLYAWSRALTHMREKITERAVARLCIGGKLEGYKGRMAGLIEEPLLSLRAGKPLFLVGALGGCTKLFIDLLEQQGRPEMNTSVTRQNVGFYDKIVELFAEHSKNFPTREEIAEEIKIKGQCGPSNALKNGLDDDENRVLFNSSDPLMVAELVLTGLERLGV